MAIFVEIECEGQERPRRINPDHVVQLAANGPSRCAIHLTPDKVLIAIGDVDEIALKLTTG